jgi:hypothetical protein
MVWDSEALGYREKGVYEGCGAPSMNIMREKTEEERPVENYRTNVVGPEGNYYSINL